ncbi:MAG: CPBP family intramembrane glutamic endopeptidase [Flavisolibacter sp.]
MKSIVLVGDILMIAFLWLFPHFGVLPIYAYPPVLLLILWLWLRFQKRSFAAIGFKWNQASFRSLVIGIALALGYFFLYYFVVGPLLTNYLHIPTSDVSDFYFVRSSFSRYITILVIAWVLAVPFEEIIFRGFIFYKLLQWTGKKFWLAGFTCSVLFGAYHLQQGWGGVIHAFIFGMVTTALYKYFKGNLWYLIFFHSAYDTIAITAIRLGYF